MVARKWSDPDRALESLVNEFHDRCLKVYREDPNRVEEDAGKERGIAEGGYGRKQIQELIQNSTDALQGSPGRIQVTLTPEALYVANEGKPFEASGVRALLYTHLSNKTGNEIGRFGLGFKSISGISDDPQIFSQSVSFEFNRTKAAEELTSELGVNFGAEQVPALRLAWVIDPVSESRTDPVLSEMLAWAVTVVKVPLKPGAAELLSEEIKGFDESFILFAPHVRQLDLRDDVAGDDRHFAASKKGNRVTLTTVDGDREWLVVSHEHRPSTEALESAGHSASREVVTVSWAVPVTGRPGVGQLSAFFPVKSDTTLSGRINAPWKLSDDRINVIECTFNAEILTEVVPRLVVNARRDLAVEGSYGRYIDILPARGREIRSWADSVLNEPVYDALREARCLPDLDGQLRSPNSLRRIPEDAMEHAASWLTAAGQRDSWIHPDCTSSPERRSKVDRLLQNNPKPVGRILDWLQSVVEDATPDHSAVAIELADKLVSGSSRGANTELDVRDARIVLLENGLLQQPVRGRCFIRTNSEQEGSVFVHGEVSGRKSTRLALEHLGITTFDDGGEMLQLLHELAKTGSVDWDALWTAMRGCGVSQVGDAFDKIFNGKAHMIVRVRDGRQQWVPPEGHYLPGECLRPLKEDGAFLVDADYHAADREILALLGIRGRPTRSAAYASEKWVGRYRATLVEEVGEHMGLGIRSRDNIAIHGMETVLGPLQSLPEFSATNRAALTAAVINDIHDSRVKVEHPNVPKPARYVAPELWWVRQHGMLQTSFGPMEVRHVFVAGLEEEYPGLLPTPTGVVLSAELEKALRLKRRIEDLTPAEFEALLDLHVERNNLDQVGRAYGWWCLTHQDNPPAKMWVRHAGTWTQYEPSCVAVVTSIETHAELESFGIPCAVVETVEDVFNLREFWGCIEGKQLPVTYTYETSAEPESLLDVFDVLDNLDLDDDPEDLTLQRCLSISKVAAVPGQPEVRVECHSGREGNTILVTGGTDRDILKQVLGALLFDDSDEQVDVLLEDMRRRRDSKLVRDIKNAPDDAERLLRFAGEDRLRTLIPKDALDYLAHTVDGGAPHGVDLARLCITMHGVRALERVCKVEPHGLPLTPPSKWHGSFNTRQWVARLGFGEEWAGQKARRRNKPTEYVDGPALLNELHDYQRIVSERLSAMLRGEGPSRGLISLPTGAGKTRVAVQTIIEAIRRGDLDELAGDTRFSGPILWLADGEELCEQAIDAWSYLWRAVGRQDTQLVLSRFWSNYETEEEGGGVQVVVATWQKVLSRAVDKPDFEWLADTPLVIIDEAHGATHKSYTRILEWTGRTRSERGKLLLGLTATPFRGKRDSEETARLLRRFDENRLDEGVFGAEHPQVRLQRDRVLARASLEILNGVSMDLTEEEIAWFREKYWLPTDAAKRLGRREDRTRMILDSILSKPADWPIVVFAASVENAQTLATLLTLNGRPAAAIDQDTSPEDRRLAIERFKNGELSVLTNYAVLSQGFDAPRTRAVYITRPTSSEVRYQQMVGRGLRGPRNGGSEEVLIVNVLDNLVEFGDSIVYESLKEIIAEGAESDASAT
ncbi:DEAD/DEAH box helicase [Gordonia paraffinivorans]|uniref:DEAD/DEAH box helicase n=1 Tax=Gordonia paraffinivorans TaxID=175628 RepID=UPI001FF987FA|nr:DEAD/DEAH box helicase family protein [Gordonia paraffinivorans]